MKGNHFSTTYPLDGNPKVTTFKNKDGLNICSYAWKATNPTAAVIGIHGIQMHCRMEYLQHTNTEKSGKHCIQRKDGESGQEISISDWCVYKGSWVEYLNSRGISFFGMDLQSHGSSDGWKNYRCNVEKFDNFAEDVTKFVEMVCTEVDSDVNESSKKPIPVFLMGISMGGCVVIRTIEKMAKEGNVFLKRTDGCRLSGVIALAPMLSVEKILRKPLNRILLPFASILSALAPNLPITDVEPNERCPWIEERKIEDPLVCFPAKVPVRLSSESLKAMANAQADGHYIPEDFPMFFVHSELDTMVEIEGTDKFIKEAAPQLKNIELMRLKDMWHYLTCETGNENVLKGICEWIKKQEGEEKEKSRGNSEDGETPQSPLITEEQVPERKETNDLE